MTEKEKQQAGEMYFGGDKELLAERVAAKKLCVEYNAIPCNDYQKKERLLDRLLALRGEDSRIEANFVCDYGYNIVIGDNFSSDCNCVILDSAEVTFGNDVKVGANCTFCTVEYPEDIDLRRQGMETAKPIKIGSDVVIGGNVTVLPGVTVGDNVIIQGGSVISEDVPSDCIAAGNPCKMIKSLKQ